MERTVFVLAGHYTGKSINLNGHQFIEGKCEIWCPGDILPFVKRSLSSYQAFPERSYELELAQKRDEENGLWNNSDTSAEQREPAKVPSNDKPTSNGSAQKTSNDGLPNANPDNGSTGGVSEGDGREDAGLSEVTSEIDWRLKEIIESLDPNEDDHWTSEGLPSIEAIQSAFGPNVTREDIDVSGEGWTKDKALEKQAVVAPVKRGRGRPKKTKEVAG